MFCTWTYGLLFVNTSNLTAFDTGDLTEGSNLYYTDARAQAVSINNVVEDTTPQLGGTLDTNGNDIQISQTSGVAIKTMGNLGSADLTLISSGSQFQWW